MSVFLKHNKLSMQAIQEEEQRIEEERKKLNNVTSEMAHLEKRVAQRGDEISVLRETVKTLYA